MHKENYSETKSFIGLEIQIIVTDTDTSGEVIDTQCFESGKVVLSVGVVTAGDITIKEVLESASATPGSGTAIPADRLVGPTTLSVLVANGTIAELGFVSTLRYIEPIFTTANSAALTAGAVVELGDASSAPVDK